MALEYFLLWVILYNSIWRQYIWDRVPPSFFCYRDILIWHPFSQTSFRYILLYQSSIADNSPLHSSLSSNRCRQLSITSFSIILSLHTFSHFILHVASFLNLAARKKNFYIYKTPYFSQKIYNDDLLLLRH